MDSNDTDATVEEASKLQKILIELLNSKEPVTQPLKGGLYIKYEPAVNFYPHRLMIFRKGVHPEGDRRNWPSEQEKQVVLRHFFKVMKRLNRTITGRIPSSEEDSKKQNGAGEWFYAKSWFWSELIQRELFPEAGKRPSGYKES